MKTLGAIIFTLLISNATVAEEAQQKYEIFYNHPKDHFSWYGFNFKNGKIETSQENKQDTGSLRKTETFDKKAASEELKRQEDEINQTKKDAEKGDPEAQFYLGEFYLQGVGVEPNTYLAEEWFKKSAENKNNKFQARAEGRIGRMTCLRGDLEKSEYWYRKAYKRTGDDTYWEIIKRIVEAKTSGKTLGFKCHDYF